MKRIKHTDSQEEMLSPRQLAENLGVHKQTVLYWIKTGRLLPDQQTLGGHFRFYRSTALRLEREIKGGQREVARVSTDREGVRRRSCHKPIGLPEVQEELFKRLEVELHHDLRQLNLVEHGQNAIRLDIDIPTMTANLRSSQSRDEDRPYLKLSRLEDRAVSLEVGFETIPTIGFAADEILDCLARQISSMFFILKNPSGPIHQSRSLVVHPLRLEGWYWLVINGYDFLIDLPVPPTLSDWECFDVAGLISRGPDGERQHLIPEFYDLPEDEQTEKNKYGVGGSPLVD